MPTLANKKKSHSTWSIVYTKWSNLIGYYARQRIGIGPGKSHHCQTWVQNRFSWIENLQRKQNWTAKSTSLKEHAEMSSQSLLSEQPCEPKSLGVVLNIAGVDKIHSENLWLRSTLEAIRFETSVSEGGNLCPLWMVILKSVWYIVGDTL